MSASVIVLTDKTLLPLSQYFPASLLELMKQRFLGFILHSPDFDRRALLSVVGTY